MPLYNSASCAIALEVTPKWLDNVLSHHVISGVQQARQGIPRRLSSEAIEILAVARSLTESVGVSMADAIEIGRQLCAESGSVSEPTHRSTVALTELISLSIDRRRLREELDERLARAMEITPQPARGRPPKPKS